MCNEFLTLKEASELLQLGADSIRRLIESGDLPAAKLDPKHTILLREHVVEFVRTKATQQAASRKAGNFEPIKNQDRPRRLPPVLANREEVDIPQPVPAQPTLVPLSEVMQRVGLRKTAIYAAIAGGTFPAPIKIGNSTSRWIEIEIQDWIARLVAARSSR